MSEGFEKVYDNSITRIVRCKLIPFHKKKDYFRKISKYHDLIENECK